MKYILPDKLIKSYPARLIIVFLTVSISVKASLLAATPPYYLLLIWPAFGLSAGFCIVYGIRTFPAAILALFVSSYFHNYSSIELLLSPFFIALIVSLIGGLNISVKVFFFNHFIRKEHPLYHATEILKIVFLFISLSIGFALTLFLIANYSDIDFIHSTRSFILFWTGADLCGTLIFTPFILSFSSENSAGSIPDEFRIHSFIPVVLILLGYFVILFFPLLSENIFFFLIPLLFLTAFRNNIRHITSYIVLVSILAAYVAINETHNTSGSAYFQTILLYQIYLMIIAPTFLLIHAFANKLRHTKDTLTGKNQNMPSYGDTARMTKDQQLSIQFELIKTAIEQSPGSILITKPDGEIEYVNAAFSKITGYSYDEVIGKNPRILKTDHHTNSFYTQLWTTILEGKTWKGQFYNKKKDGSCYWEEATIAPIYTNKKITHFICTKEDITGLKSMVESLRDSERQFRALAENAPIFIAKINHDGILIYLNKFIENFKHDEIIGKTVYELFDKKYHSITRENIAVTFKTKMNTSFEVTLKYEDNSLRFCDVLITPFIEKEHVIYAILILQDITEIVTSREVIRESEKKYRLLAENAADVIWVTDANMKYTYISPSAEYITGYSADEILKLPIDQVFLDVSKDFLPELNKLKNNKLHPSGNDINNKWENFLKRKDGEMIWLESKIQPVYNANGHLSGIIGVSRDVTQRKQSESALRESEKKFRAFFENANAIILLIDPATGKIESANKAATIYYGYGDEEIKKLTFNDINAQYHSDSDKTFPRNISSDISDLLTGKRKVLSLQHQLKNGRIKDVELYPTPVQINDRILFFTIIQDVTRRKKAISALKESESKKLALLKSIPDLIYIINREGMLLDIYTDKPANLIMPPSKMLGKKLVTLLPTELTERFEEIFQLTFESRNLKTLDFSYIDSGKRVYEEARMIASGVDELLVIIRNITNLKEGEQELKKAWKEAEKANNAKSVFLANVSHEIRTPINAVIGFTELLSQELNDSHLQNYLTSIKSSSKTLLSLIEDVLDLSKIEAGEISIKPEMVSIRSIFEEIKNIFWLKMQQKKLKFNIDIADNVPDILYLDELRLRQILINLVGNAFKFTEKGKIDIKVAAANQIESGKSLWVDLQIDVSDSGIGIPEKIQETIFDSFKQHDDQDSRKYGGTGLGLAITKRLVVIMKGTINVLSKTGHGSTFRVLLPQVSTGSFNQIDKRINLNTNANVRFKDAGILIADDVLTNRELIRGAIKGENLHFYEATNGIEAMELVKIHEPDIVLMDISMPKSTGFDVAREMRESEKYKNIPIIAISAIHISEREKYDVQNFNVFLSKPFNINELITHIMNYLPDKIIRDINDKREIQHENYREIRFDDSKVSKIKVDIGSLIAKHKAVSETSSFMEINDFAKTLIEFAEFYQVDVIMTIAEKIKIASDNFDIEEITQHIAEIPEILNKILDHVEK